MRRVAVYPLPSVEELRERFVYDLETGRLHHRHDVRGGPWNRIYNRAGEELKQGRDRGGYLSVHVGPRKCMQHRIVWAMAHGEWPPDEIDHINGDHGDNRLENLRVVTPSENMHNLQGPRKDNTTGYLGVTRASRGSSKFIAQIVLHNKHRYLGTFSTPEEAYQAYMAAKRVMHPTSPMVTQERP